MEIIQSGKGTGKTFKLMQLANKCNGYIVCRNREQANFLHDLAFKNGYNINLPITADEFFGGQFYGSGVKKFYIDNIDAILQDFSKGVPIVAVTSTSELTKYTLLEEIRDVANIIKIEIEKRPNHANIGKKGCLRRLQNLLEKYSGPTYKEK